MVDHKIPYNPETAKILKQVQAMEVMAQTILTARLNDLIAESEMALAVAQDQGFITSNELGNLKGKSLYVQGPTVRLFVYNCLSLYACFTFYVCHSF